MAIEIRIESTWDTDDGEGRRVEVTVSERRHPAEDPLEDSRYFASGDLERLKRYVCDLLDAKRSALMGPPRRECERCHRVVATAVTGSLFLCPECRELADSSPDR